MCLNCGCGEPDARHQPTDITREDVERAAQGGGLTVDQAIANLSESLSKLDTGSRTDAAAESR
jgi:hypothetical protein